METFNTSVLAMLLLLTVMLITVVSGVITLIPGSGKILKTNTSRQSTQRFFLKKVLTITIIALVCMVSIFTHHEMKVPTGNCSGLLYTKSSQDNMIPGAVENLKPKNKPVQKQKNLVKIDTSTGWLAKINRDIAKMEYNISFDSSANSFQCPNRRNNIRAYFAPGTFTMKNRLDSIDHNWTVKLINQGLYADGNVLELPQQNAIVSNNENELSIQHCSFEEQYINTSEGVRQNFIIYHAPEQTDELKIRMKVEGLLVEKTNPKELHFYQQRNERIENIITYKDLKVWDVANKELEAHFETTGNEIAIIVDAKDAQYPITIDPISTTVATTLSGTQSNDEFGHSLASTGDVNGDGYSDVIVGAYSYDGNGQLDRGAAFIYHGSASGISTVYSTMLQGNQAHANFGITVASAGDVNGDGFSDIIVSSFYQYGSTNLSSGTVYVYKGSATGINTNIMNVLHPTSQNNALFGFSAACAGDVNNDGFSDIVVGAPFYGTGGAAFVFNGSVNGIVANTSVLLQPNQADAEFGYSVASAGDVNGDGYSDIVISAIFYDNPLIDEGAVFVYHGSPWGINVFTIRLECNQANAQLGHSVASAGDVNGDGYSDIIVGVWKYENSPQQIDEGVAIIYYGSSNGLNASSMYMLQGNQADALFGWSVACAGDVNGDGYSDVIVGAPYYDSGVENEGAAFVYLGMVSGISNVATVLESNQFHFYLGEVVASAGDVNGDGYSDIIVSTNLATNNGQATITGAYIYHGSATNINAAAVATLESNQYNAYMGTSVASAGDINGDGYSDIIIGAPSYDNGHPNEGAAFVYTGSANGINTNTGVAFMSSHRDNASFGISVASAGDVNGDGYSDVIVGAYKYTFNSGLTNEGGAFVYYGTPGGLITTSASLLKGIQSQGEFGISVASAGDVNGDGYADVIVGAPSFDNIQADAGRAFIYKGTSSGIPSTVIPSIVVSNQTGSRFGASVASAGDINGDSYSDVIVGAPMYDNNGLQRNEGRAFIYKGSGIGTVTTIADTLQSSQANAEFGNSVACAGDINGDGYADIIIGAHKFDLLQFQNAGAAFVYNGSASGITSTAVPDIIQFHQANADFGGSVASAGDVNGDGYSDVIVGARLYEAQPNMDIGAAVVYLGSPAGVTYTNAVGLISNQVNCNFGYSVASAGDVNGDGYSDVIVGAPSSYNNGQTNEGRAFVYLGNNGNYSAGLQNNIRLYNTDLNTPLKQSNIPNSTFGASLYSKSFLGRNESKLVWETKKDGQGFSNVNTITNSTQFTNQQTSYTDLGIDGIELKNIINKQYMTPSTKIRVRVKYNPVTAVTGQVYGPWRYMPGYVTGLNIHNNVPRINGQPLSFGKDGVRDELSDSEIMASRLKSLSTEDKLKVYPNPFSDNCTIEFSNIPPKQLDIYNIFGQLVKTITVTNLAQRTLILDLSDISSGTYYLLANGKELSKLVKVK